MKYRAQHRHEVTGAARVNRHRAAHRHFDPIETLNDEDDVIVGGGNPDGETPSSP
jgi:hypothetical protein